MKPRPPFSTSLSAFRLRSTPLRDFATRPLPGLRVRPFIIHTLALRPLRHPVMAPLPSAP